MPRILVADDNTNIQKMVSLAFQDRGVEVTSVGNGEAAVRRLPDLNPDLILADIFMPVRNGYELCEWVKKDSKYSHIPVILLVGAFDPLDEKEARRVGADGVLKKPFIPPDPLIAMVISTLEKNPKLAAELAQAREPREAKIAAPPSAPVVAPEIPKKIELQPVRDVPESSTDDASLAFGFGAGRRGLENDGPEESAAARAPKSDFDKQTEEEFDGASTAKDWRRSAMAFEVPEEASRMAAFSEEESEPVSSQNGEAADRGNAPPAIEFHRAGAQPEVEAAVIEVDPVEIDALEAEPAVSPDQLQSFHSADESGTNSADDESEWASDEPDVPAYAFASPTETTSKKAEPVSSSVAKIDEPSAVAESLSVAEIPPVVENGSAGSTEPEPVSKPKSSHWMDLMGSVSNQPQSDWLSLINAQSNAQPADKTQASPLPEKAEEMLAFRSEAPSELPFEDAVPRSAHADNVVTKQASQQESPKPSVSDFSAPAHESSEIPGPQVRDSEDEDWFFADEPAAAAEAISGSIEFSSGAAGSARPSGSLQEAPAPEQANSRKSGSQAQNSPAEPAEEFEATVAEPVAVNSLHEDTEFVEEQSQEPVVPSEPELIQPPAVHVTPEPLLIDESSPKPSAAYGTTDQEIAPTYEFLPEVATKASEDSSSPESSDPAVEESVEAVSCSACEAEAEDSQPAFSLEEAGDIVSLSAIVNALPSNSSSSAPAEQPVSAEASSSAKPDNEAAPQFTTSDFNPSTPVFVRPPTREQLAHIPFLNPPPHLDQEAEPAPSHSTAETQAIDTVVQRILDKIEPQLHDLLAQNLKPLIENLVHTELKKER